MFSFSCNAFNVFSCRGVIFVSGRWVFLNLNFCCNSFSAFSSSTILSSITIGAGGGFQVSFFCRFVSHSMCYLAIHFLSSGI
jgi:hypothetical protein